MRLLRITSVLLIGLAPCSGLLLMAAGFDVRPGVRMTMSGFKTRGCREDGSVEWEILGAKAEVRGVLAELTQVKLTLYLREREPVLITSPSCSFNQASEAGSSDAPIHVKSRSFRLDGVGYDVLVGQQRLHVRSRVRMRIRKRQDLLEKVISPPDSASGGAADGVPSTQSSE